MSHSIFWSKEVCQLWTLLMIWENWCCCLEYTSFTLFKWQLDNILQKFQCIYPDPAHALPQIYPSISTYTCTCGKWNNYIILQHVWYETPFYIYVSDRSIQLRPLTRHTCTHRMASRKHGEENNQGRTQNIIPYVSGNRLLLPSLNVSRGIHKKHQLWSPRRGLRWERGLFFINFPPYLLILYPMHGLLFQLM